VRKEKNLNEANPLGVQSKKWFDLIIAQFNGFIEKKKTVMTQCDEK